ncbi:MAG TPA: hypothetical protein VHS97_10815 [Isosphaeraceae bacterium]|nr:hypothetical protein [Isosphaeraceae bacterium]
MRSRRRSIVSLVAVLAASVIATGCSGSSASTSRSEAAAVAHAERAFIKSWDEATAKATDRCEATANPEHCFALAFRPGAKTVVSHFNDAIEAVMADGVGSECTAALEEALVEPAQIPSFPGPAAAACRAESRDD